jgi:WD40 repeat protein
MRLQYRKAIVIAALAIVGVTATIRAAPVPLNKLVELAHYEKFDSIPQALCFHPDGKMLASAHRDGQICLRNIATGKVTILKGHVVQERLAAFGSVNCLVFSPDGKTFATGGDDHTVRLWNVSDGKNFSVFKTKSNVTSVVYSPDGKRMAVSYAGGVELWDPEKEECVNRFSERSPGLYPVSFTSKGKALTITRDFKLPEFTIWDIETGKKIITCKGHTKTLDGFALNAQGTMAASSDLDKLVLLWDVATGKNIATVYDLPDFSHVLKFSPDGKLLACGGRPRLNGADATNGVHIFQVSNKRLLKVLKGHQKTIYCLTFSTDGKFLASASSELIKVWQLPLGWKDLD